MMSLPSATQPASGLGATGVQPSTIPGVTPLTIRPPDNYLAYIQATPDDTEATFNIKKQLAASLDSAYWHAMWWGPYRPSPRLIAELALLMFNRYYRGVSYGERVDLFLDALLDILGESG